MYRLSIRYAGRVQGVGFRVTVASLARDYPVVGRVCNMSDGRVDLVAEGDQQTLIAFRDRIAQAMQRNIVNAAEQWCEVDEPHWNNFAIGHDMATREE